MRELVPKCLKCKEPSVPNKKFCTNCGFNIEEVREEKRKRIRIQELKESKKTALSNCYALFLITGIPIVIVMVGERAGVNSNLLTYLYGWGFAAATVIYLLSKHISLKELFTGNSILKWTAIGFLICVFMLAVNLGYHYLLITIFDIDKESLSEGINESGMSLIAAFFYIAVMPGIWEELVFRGLLLKELEIIITPVEAAVLSSVIFAMFHMTIFSFPYLAAFGYIMVVLRRKSCSLIPGMIIHAAHNAFVVIYEVWF